MTILAATTSHRGSDEPVRMEAVRAEALFASTLQRSQFPSPDQVRREVTSTLRRLGTGGCAERLAGEFGDHPDAAVARMTWAVETIRSVYPTGPTASTVPAPPSIPLEPAS